MRTLKIIFDNYSNVIVSFCTIISSLIAAGALYISSEQMRLAAQQVAVSVDVMNKSEMIHAAIDFQNYTSKACRDIMPEQINQYVIDNYWSSSGKTIFDYRMIIHTPVAFERLALSKRIALRPKDWQNTNREIYQKAKVLTLWLDLSSEYTAHQIALAFSAYYRDAADHFYFGYWASNFWHEAVRAAIDARRACENTFDKAAREFLLGKKDWYVHVLAGYNIPLDRSGPPP